MKQAGFHIEKRLRFAGILLIFSLLTEAVTLRTLHPLAFVIFVCLGGLFWAAGIVVYLYSLVPTDSPGIEEAAQSENRP